MKHVSDWKQLTANRVNKGSRKRAWVLTNLGVLDGDPDGSHTGTTSEAAGDAIQEARWRIEKAMFLLATDMAGDALVLSTMSVKGRGLTVACTWQDGVVDDSLAQRFIGTVREQLEYLGAC